LSVQSTFENIQRGDVTAFEKVFNDHYDALCFYAVKIISDHDEAEEVVQNTFVNVWNKKEQLEVKGSLKSYLFQSVHNACLNILKHKKVEREYESYQLQVAENIDHSDDLVSAELKEEIERALQTLPGKRRKIFLMNRMEGFRYKEIAEKMGLSIKTVENQIGRALKQLRGELSEFLSLLIWISIEIIKQIDRWG